jgi:hypothetical protein
VVHDRRRHPKAVEMAGDGRQDRMARRAGTHRDLRPITLDSPPPRRRRKGTSPAPPRHAPSLHGPCSGAGPAKLFGRYRSGQ